MVNEQQRRAFISYSRVNKEFATKLAKGLRSAGYPVWFDQLDIPTGSRWDDEVEKALHECNIFMIILTPASVASENVKDEIGYAIGHGKRMLPILLEKCEIPFRLRRFQYVDFTTKSFDEGFASAKELLGDLVDEASVPIPTTAPAVEAPAKDDHLTAQKAKADQKNIVSNSAEQIAGGTKSRKTINDWLQIWWSRGLIVAVVMIVLGFVMGLTFDIVSVIVISIIVGVFGFMFYPHKVSYILTAVFSVIGYFIFASLGGSFLFTLWLGVGLGFIPAAIISRILRATKMI